MVEFEDRPAIGDEHAGEPTWRSLGLKLGACVGILAALAVGLTVVLGVLVLPLGVWMPDVITGRVNNLGEITSADGQRFRVVQYWNYADFYSTKLLQTRPDGSTTDYVLDGDDFKAWHGVTMMLDSQAHVITVTLSGNRRKTIDWVSEKMRAD